MLYTGINTFQHYAFLHALLQVLFRIMIMTKVISLILCLTFNQKRLQAKSKVHTDVLDELLYVDDIIKNA